MVDNSQLPLESRKLLEQLVRETSTRRTAADLGVTRESVARAIAGLPVRPCTLEVLKAKLQAKP